MVLHRGRVVPQLGATVLVVPGPHSHYGTVTDFRQRDHFERHRQRLVGPPVAGQGGAHDVGAAGSDQLAGVLVLDLVDHVVQPPQVLVGVRARGAVAHPR